MRLRLLTAVGAAALAFVTTGCGGDTAVGGASEVTTPTPAAPNDGAGTSPTNPPATLRSDPTPATEPPTLATEPPTPTTEASTSTTPANCGCRRITDFDDLGLNGFHDVGPA